MGYMLEVLLLSVVKNLTLNGKQSGNEKVLVIPLSTSFALLASVLKSAPGEYGNFSEFSVQQIA